ncbi:MAG TPA: prolipoprotein diacylglyceryl transferase, partial [Firmicutes bacterium]|nr:prolipoprotein diacylglyceryl transferase [Bacillota bacterium]
FSGCYACIGLMIGGKILYLLTILPTLWNHRDQITEPLELIQDLLLGGFVFYGGLCGALAGILLYARQFHLDAFRLLDLLTPVIPLVHAVGRVGCFCAGCCYGRPVDPPFGVYFEASLTAPHDMALFPVQLLESALNLLLFGILLFLGRKPRKKGTLLGLYLSLYAVLRFGLEFLRYDAERGSFLFLSTSQWISLFLLPVGLWLFFLREDAALFYKMNFEGKKNTSVN